MGSLSEAYYPCPERFRILILEASISVCNTVRYKNPHQDLRDLSTTDILGLVLLCRAGSRAGQCRAVTAFWPPPTRCQQCLIVMAMKVSTQSPRGEGVGQAVPSGEPLIYIIIK